MQIFVLENESESAMPSINSLLPEIESFKPFVKSFPYFKLIGVALCHWPSTKTELFSPKDVIGFVLSIPARLR